MMFDPVTLLFPKGGEGWYFVNDETQYFPKLNRKS